MKSLKWSLLALSCGAVLLAAGCADNDEIRADINNLQSQTYSLQNQVQALEGNIQNTQKSSSTQNEALHTMRASQADVVDQMSSIQNDIKTLRGKLEEEKHFTQKLLADQSSQTSDLARRVNQMQAELDAQGQKLSALDLQVKQVQTQAQAQAQAQAAAQTSPQQTSSTVKGSSVQSIYDDAYKAFKNKKYSKAIKGFEDVLKEYPDDPLAGNAQFWIGESYFEQKHYDQAILSYEDVLKHYPKSRKAPAALLKQGIAFMNTKDDKVSAAIFQQLLDRYPRTQEARTAKSELAKMKKKDRKKESRRRSR